MGLTGVIGIIRLNSSILHTEAQDHLVGGVNSPVRAFKSVHGSPVYFQQANGAIVTDVDGNEYVDFVQSWGPLIHGHSHPKIIADISEVMSRGTSFGAPHLGEIELARMVKERYPHIDMVRFTSSGTEAAMSAVRLARGYTGRDHIVKFDGCYHGHIDALLVNSGSGLATFGIASSPGIPKDTISTTLVSPLDDIDAVRYLFEEYPQKIAAVLIEPLPANNGLLIQRDEFLRELRELCTENGTLLVFDEVISGFRFREGGYGGFCGITPDITALGKIIGGGLPVGAYGACKEVMQHLSPLGPVYQAGTLSGNPLAMAAGISTLSMLDDAAYARLDSMGERMERLISPILEKFGNPFRLARLESLFWFSPGKEDPPRRADMIPSDAAEKYADLHKGMLDRGFMLAPSAYEIGFLSTSHQEGHIDGMASALEKTLSDMEI